MDYCAEPRPAHCGKNADEVLSRFLGLYIAFFFETYAVALAGALAIFVLCAYYRQRLYAALYGKPAEGGCGSCLLHCCCHRCALCQEARAAKHATYQAPTAAYVGLVGADCQHMDRERARFSSQSKSTKSAGRRHEVGTSRPE
jgi:Cys-rich protein (TIGR01571 family)